jgi:hypothetical protein
VIGYEQEDVGTNVEQGDEVSGCGGGWVIFLSYLLQRSMTLVDLRSTVHNYFGSSGFGPFQCIVPTILPECCISEVRDLPPRVLLFF